MNYTKQVRFSRSQWPPGLRRRSAAARLLRLWVRILPTVMRRFVWSRNLMNEEAMAHWEAVAPITNEQTKKVRFNQYAVPPIIFLGGSSVPQLAIASSFMRFLDHTQRRTTVCRTPLNEWSARCRDLYLTTHNTDNRHPCPRWDSNSQTQETSGRRPTP